MLTFGPYYPWVLSETRPTSQLLMRGPPEQVSKDPSQKPGVDLVVVRENTECLVRLCVFQPSAIPPHVG